MPTHLCRRPRRARLLVVVAALGVLGTACSDDDGDVEAFCATARAHQDALMGLTPAQSPEQVREDLPGVLDVLDDLVGDAPGEVRGPADRLRDLLQDIEDVDPDDDAAYGRVVLELLDDATERDAIVFTDFVRQRCGVDLRTTTTAASGAATDPTTPTTG